MLTINCGLLIREATACVDTAKDSTEDMGGVLNDVLVVLVNNEEGRLPDIPIMLRFTVELGTEVDGKDDGTFDIGTEDGGGGGGGPTTDVTGLLMGTLLRIEKALDVAIVDVVANERDATDDTRFTISEERLVSKEIFQNIS